MSSCATQHEERSRKTNPLATWCPVIEKKNVFLKQILSVIGFLFLFLFLFFFISSTNNVSVSDAHLISDYCLTHFQNETKNRRIAHSLRHVLASLFLLWRQWPPSISTTVGKCLPRVLALVPAWSSSIQNPLWPPCLSRLNKVIFSDKGTAIALSLITWQFVSVLRKIKINK